MQERQSRDLASSTKSFQDLLKLIENTNNTYKKHLTNVNVNNNKKSQLTKDEMEKEIFKCEQEYDNIVLNNVKKIAQNNNIVSLNYDINDIKQTVENKLIRIKTSKYNGQFIQNYANIKFYHINPDSLYSICQFDLKYTELRDGSTIDCDNKHIKIGSKNGNSYGMILPDTQNVQGYTSGQHCFRMYYKNPKGPNQWLFFGIYKYGVVPKDANTPWHETSWGIGDDGNGRLYCNGKVEYDSNMSFLYSLNENQVDMLVDFDNGIVSYSIVDDKVKNKKYTLKKKFNTNIAYTVHLQLLWGGTQVQIAKINVDMFGKNKEFVKWPIEKY